MFNDMDKLVDDFYKQSDDFINKQKEYEKVDNEWHEQAQKMEKYFDEFGTTLPEDNKKLNELSLKRIDLQYGLVDRAQRVENDEKSQYQIMGD